MLRFVGQLAWIIAPIIGLVLFVLWLFGIFPPSSRVQPGEPILESVKHVNKQIFVEHYNTVDVTYTEVPNWIGNFGIKQEFVILIRGRVPAGFDLEQVTEEDVWVSSDGKRAQLTLPSPIIFKDNVSIDFENSYILAQRDTCPGFICEDNLTAYQSQVLPKGREVLIQAASDNGILEQTAKDGREYYEMFLKSLGYEEVRIVVEGYGL